MKYRKIMFAFALLPVMAMAQVSATQPAMDPPNAETRAVLLANCPRDMSEAEWLKLMTNPVNASLYPLRITQAMLDTLDASRLNPRYQYIVAGLQHTAPTDGSR